MMMKEVVPEFKSNNCIYEELDALVLDPVNDTVSDKEHSGASLKDASN